MNRTNLLLLMILAMVLLCGSLAWGEDPDLNLIDGYIQNATRLINSWEHNALLALLIALAIGVLGFLTGALQKSEASWVKTATVICGIVIGSLTVVSNTVFEHNHRQFRSMARQGQILLYKMEALRVHYASATPDNQRAMAEDAFKNLNAIYRLEAQDDRVSQNVWPISLAYAAEDLSWLKQLPVDAENFYFIGIADNQSYESAKHASKENALDEAVAYFMSLFAKGGQESQVDNESLSNYLVKSAQVQDTHFVYDSHSTSYRYYTLLRISKRIATADLRLFSIGKKESVPAVYNSVVQQAQRSPDDYLSRRLDIRTKSLDNARQSLTSEQYGKFSKARELRKEKQYDKAIALLSDIVRERDDFYLGWYNLAVNYDDKQDFSNAKRAFDRAVEIEPKQPARDASVYNSYGFFFYRYKRYEDAIRYLKIAIELDPNHPTASKTLQAAERAKGK